MSSEIGREPAQETAGAARAARTAAAGPRYLLVEPTHYDVSYAINPWMRPQAWSDDPQRHRAEAAAAAAALRTALERAGAAIELAPGVPGLPDLVFPANGGIVLDGRALVARFRHPQRRGEEAVFHRLFERMRAEGRLREVLSLPEGCFQEGAGDCVWDRTRGLAWTAHGPRSSAAAADVIADTFGIGLLRLELVDPRFYHLDTCLCVLPGGEVLYYPAAFSPAGLAVIEAHVKPAQRLVASDADAAGFCVNAVALDRQVVMATPPARLADRLRERGYEVCPVGLAPFILSGGGAYCMTLRLDLATRGPGAGTTG